jgi:polyisoprenoid-binding protein YceI
MGDAPTGAIRYRDREKTMTRAHITVVAIIALIGTSVIGAQETARVAVASESKLWIEGTSNLHGWKCAAEKMDAAIEVDAAAATQIGTAAPSALKKVHVKVPVRSLKCGHGAMDNNLYKALNADASPDVSYILATFEATPNETKDSFTLHTVGTLTVAGKENKLEMDVVATRMPDGSVTAKGVVPIKMTDFGIQPPTAIFGRLKTGNEVKVGFDLLVSAKAIAAAAGQP